MDGGVKQSRQEVAMRARGYMGTGHAARHMSVTDEQIRKLFKGGKLRGQWVGRRLYITIESLKEYYGPLADELLAMEASEVGPDLGPVGPGVEPCPPGMEPRKQCVPSKPKTVNTYPATNVPQEFQTPNPNRRK
jgi:hypothetical protein